MMEYFVVMITEILDLTPSKNIGMYRFKADEEEVQSGSPVMFNERKGRVLKIGDNGSIRIRFDKPFEQKMSRNIVIKT
jgi:hypothetical protein